MACEFKPLGSIQSSDGHDFIFSEENIKNQEIVGLKMTGLKNRVSGKNRLNVFEADLVEQKLKS